LKICLFHCHPVCLLCHCQTGFADAALCGSRLLLAIWLLLCFPVLSDMLLLQFNALRNRRAASNASCICAALVWCFSPPDTSGGYQPSQRRLQAPDRGPQPSQRRLQAPDRGSQPSQRRLQAPHNPAAGLRAPCSINACSISYLSARSASGSPAERHGQRPPPGACLDMLKLLLRPATAPGYLGGQIFQDTAKEDIQLTQ